MLIVLAMHILTVLRKRDKIRLKYQIIIFFDNTEAGQVGEIFLAR